MDNELLQRLLPLAEAYVARKAGKVVKALAAGGSAAVYVVEARSVTFALKVYAPELLSGKSGPAELRRIELQRGLIGHPCRYLVRLHEVTVDDSGCYVEMDYIPWLTLKELLPAVPNGAVPHLLAQLVEAARFLDSQKIVHRDIKPENILVSPDFNELRLIDLGVVRESDASEEAADATDHGHRRPFVATAQYSSPEYLFRLQAPSADMWRALTFYQIGAVLHDLLVKRPLFAEAALTENKHVISMAVFRDNADLSDAAPENAQLTALAVHCLTKDPEFRLRLVSWERFMTPGLIGTERLRAMSAQATASAQARRAFEQAQRQHQVERERYVGHVEGKVRKSLLDLGGQAYKCVVYAQGSEAAVFELRLPGGAVLHLQLVFTWSDALLPQRAVVTLVGSLNAEPDSKGQCQAAVGEADTRVSADALCDAAVDRIGHVVASTADQITAGNLPGDASGHGDLIALAGLV